MLVYTTFYSSSASKQSLPAFASQKTKSPSEGRFVLLTRLRG